MQPEDRGEGTAMAYQLGIDLGTTFTAAAVCRSSDRGGAEPEVVTLGSRSATIPSVLFVAPDGSALVGEAAERRAVTDPDRVVREFKRRIGDPTPVMVAGRPVAPTDLSAWLVRWVVARVAEREGGPAERIAVTHPASWGAHKKDLLAGALAQQGLNVTFLAEPQAAAMSYAANERINPGSTIAVYDFGGGTFDAAVVRKDESGFGVLGRPQGIERLGGIDFDQVVFEHVLQGMPEAFAELDETDPAVLSAVARIRRECTEAKEALSSDTEVSIPVLLPGSRGSVRLHRSEFEAVIRPQIEETVTALRVAVGSAGVVPEDLSAVLLVGGSSRIPLVAQLVSEQLGRPVAVDADPKNAIAKGAALAVSPMPEPVVSRSAAVPPVPAGAAGPAAYAGGPPPRPPRPGLGAPGGPPPPSFAQHGGPPPGAPQRAAQHAPQHAAQHAAPPARPPRETAPMLAHRDQPPARSAQEPDWDYEPEPQRRRPNGLVVGAGAALAVVAVLAAFLMWPDSSSQTTETGNEGSVATSEAESPGSEGGSGGSAGSGTEPAQGGAGGGAVTPTPEPTAEPTEDPAPTTNSKPSSSAKPPAATSAKPTKESDSSGGGNGGDSSGDSGSESGDNAAGSTDTEPVDDAIADTPAA
jgi:molecular chaperone DnaK